MLRGKWRVAPEAQDKCNEATAHMLTEVRQRARDEGIIIVTMMMMIIIIIIIIIIMIMRGW
jgi:predicted nucleic acid-binding Zn ribbon protein